MKSLFTIRPMLFAAGFLSLPLVLAAEAPDLFLGRAKEIIGNRDYPGAYSGDVVEIPTGLYFAEKGGKICYYDGENVVNTDVEAGAHAYQLATWNGSLFGIDAGEKVGYSEYGDGQLFMVNRHADYGFSRTVVVNNKDLGTGDVYNYISDPATIYIDQNDGTVYLGCTGFSQDGGIRMFNAADAKKFLYSSVSDIPHFLNVYNHPYYNLGITYGARTVGFQKDTQGYYWHALNFNGDGICWFNDAEMAAYDPFKSKQPRPGIGIPGVTAMYLDEPNDFLYIYVFNSRGNGVYRINISTIRNGDYLNFPSAWELIDASYADNDYATDHSGIGIRQFTTDGKYIYWCYIADPTSGLQSGIKRVNVTGDPKVEYVVKDVEGYGICYYNSKEGGVTDVSAPDDAAIAISGNVVTALNDTCVAIYSMSGVLIDKVNLSSGTTMSLNYTPGMYILKAGNTVRKIVAK